MNPQDAMTFRANYPSKLAKAQAAAKPQPPTDPRDKMHLPADWTVAAAGRLEHDRLVATDPDMQRLSDAG